MYSVVIPYPSNSKTIDMCLEYLRKNSAYEFEFVPIVDETDVYYAYNKGVYHSKYDTVVLMNDDMIVSKHWDKYIPLYSSQKQFLTLNVVEAEPGKMVSGPECIRHDCGGIEDFNYDKFQMFVDSTSKLYEPITFNTIGWYMPFVVNQKSFVSYPNINKFPWYANDGLLINKVLPELGYNLVKINSYVYHFSKASTRLNYSQKELNNVPPPKV